MPINGAKDRFGVLIAGACLAGAVVFLGLYIILQLLIDWQVRTSLLQNARLQARLWSEHLLDPLEEPREMFQTGNVSPDHIRILEASFSAIELLRFELFDADGHRIYSSSPEILGAAEEDKDDDKFREVVRSGFMHLGVFRNVNDGSQDGPITVVEAYVPAVDRSGTRLGVLEVQFDVTLLEKELQGAFLKISWLLILGTALLLALPAAALVYRTRQVRLRDKQLLELMRFDQLTGVLNRNSVNELLADLFSETGRPGSLGIVFVDIDFFKQFNDEHGHACGDAVLRHIADRLTESVRADRDIIARFGGDEFLIIVNGVDTFELRALCRRIVDNVTQPCIFEGKTLFPSLSVGVYLTRPGDAAKTAFRRADLAVYAAKRNGRGQIIEYSAELEELFPAPDSKPGAAEPTPKPA